MRLRRYRIAYDASLFGGTYRGQVWRLWWPFWVWMLGTFGETPEDAEAKLRRVLYAKQILPALALVALTACTPPPPPVVTPPLPAYTCAEQRQAADELDMLPRDAVLERMAEDYATLRAQVRALRNEPEPEGCP